MDETMEQPPERDAATAPIGAATGRGGALPGTELTLRNPWATFDRWSSNLFLLLAVLGFLVLLTVGGLAGGVTDLPFVVVALTLAIAAVGAVLLVVVSFALDRRRAWARTAAWYLLVILVLVGFGGAIFDLARGSITIPLEALAALFVMTRRPGPVPALAGRDRTVAASIGLLFLAVSVAPGVPAWLVTELSAGVLRLCA